MANRGLHILMGIGAATLVAALAACLLLSRADAAAVPGPAGLMQTAPLPDKVDFNRDIRPILSDNCFACHGPDKNKRKADLRLDSKDGLLFSHDDIHNIVPGHPEKSELYRRVITDDPEERMPDPKSNKRLSTREIALLKKWIEQGAEYKGHWAYLAPTRPEVPAIDEPGFVRNPIDRFVLERLKQVGLTHAPEADRIALIRRVYFDLIGLPPTKDEVDAFVNDKSTDAYEKVVDRLLANPHFGERMAMYWLDLVRYADTIGYHSDVPMNVSPYRDYVINAFNQNKPFDQFTIEQLAGDLISHATTEQQVASAYNRLLQTTEEGGAQAKEYEQKYVADRVRNFSTVWLASTMGCCQCHDHKFDPIPTRDFYSLGAFFADVQEASIGRREPGMPVPDEREAGELKKIDDAVADAKKKLNEPSEELAGEQEQWEDAHRSSKVVWTVLDTVKPTGTGGGFTTESDGSILAGEKGGKVANNANYTVTASAELTHITAVRLEVLADDSLPAHGPGLAPNGNFVLTEFKLGKADVKAKPAKAKPAKAVAAPDAGAPDAAKTETANSAKPKTKASKKGESTKAAAAMPSTFVRASADFSQDGFPVANAIDGKSDTGWAILPQAGKPHTAIFEFAKPYDPVEGELTLGLEFESPFPQHQIGRFRLSVTASSDPGGAIPPAVIAALESNPTDRTAEQKQAIGGYFRTVAPSLAPIRDQLAKLQQQRSDLLKTVRTCLVSTAGMPRTVRILPRGNWQDESGPIVEPATPTALNPLNVTGRRANRLDLAQWLVSRENPLTARVFVNRLWKLYFGQGISKVLDDLGAQGEWPTHPELLDWLATEFAGATPASPAASSRDGQSGDAGVGPTGSSGATPTGNHGGWDIKHIIRLLVTSGTYRQASTPTPDQLEADPFNRLYARQSRFRLDAEVVRDNALSVSGLLSDKIGGPSVFPYQPAGYWFALNFPVREWKNDTGEGLYRRGLYTHWQRSFLQPSLLSFDAPTHEEAVCERSRSNIPQQALALLNDPTYVESSRALAEKIVRDGGADTAERIRWAFADVLSRSPSSEEAALLAALYEKQHQEYADDPAAAKKLLSVGAHKTPTDLDPVELAAWTNVARTILNLSEAITRY